MEKTEDIQYLDIRGKVTGYEEAGGAVYYNMNFKSGDEDEASQWTICKRFSQFVDLHKNLAAKHADLPNLPGKTLFKLTSKNDLETRMKELNEYLQDLCRKEAMPRDSDFKNFIDLEDNLRNKVNFNKEKLLYSFPETQFGIRDFKIIKDQNILVAVCSEENIRNRVLSYWDNIKIGFLGEDSSYTAVGSLVIFRIISTEPWHVEKLWTKNFKSLPTCVYYDPSLSCIAIGLSSGKIRIFEMPHDFNFTKNVLYDTNVINAHSGEINGISIDPNLGYVYSVSKDGTLCVSDRTSGEVSFLF